MGQHGDHGSAWDVWGPACGIVDQVGGSLGHPHGSKIQASGLWVDWWDLSGGTTEGRQCQKVEVQIWFLYIEG